jgi:hypothetical protein
MVTVKKNLPAVSSQLENRLRELVEKMGKKSTPEYNPQQHNDVTRSTIALCFVKGFFIIIGGVIVLVPLYNLIMIKSGYNNEVLSLRDILPLLSGIISGPLGFVIGHYFKSEGR